jgi:hypothetical protein
VSSTSPPSPSMTPFHLWFELRRKQESKSTKTPSFRFTTAPLLPTDLTAGTGHSSKSSLHRWKATS